MRADVGCPDTNGASAPSLWQGTVDLPHRLAIVDIIPDKRKVVGLIEQAHEGKICLPNFQRDFVWTRDEVADLVRSIIRGYFIGSLLLLRCDPNNPPFAPGNALLSSHGPSRDCHIPA